MRIYVVVRPLPSNELIKHVSILISNARIHEKAMLALVRDLRILYRPIFFSPGDFEKRFF